MTYDAVTLRTVAEDLRCDIVPGRISQLRQVDTHTFVIDITTESRRAHLLVSTHPRFYRTHLLSQECPRREDATPFASQLREVLRHAVITSVHQLNGDRVLLVGLSRKNSLLRSDLRLIIELTGRMSNIIVTRSDDNVIIVCWKHVDANMCRYRRITPGQRYTPPPPPTGLDPGQADPREFEAAIRQCEGESLSRCLARSVLDFGHILAAEAIFLAGVHHDAAVSSLSSEQIEALREAVLSLLDRVRRGGMTPTVYLRESGFPLAAYPMELQQFGPTPRRQFRALSEALEYYYAAIIEASREAALRHDVGTAIRRKEEYWKRTEKRIAEELDRARRSEEYKRAGELIVANMGALRRGLVRADVIDYYDPDQATVTLKLDPKLSPEENARSYFRKAQKAKKAMSVAEKRLRQVNERLHRLAEFSKERDEASDEEALVALREKMKDAGVLGREGPRAKRPTTERGRFRRFVTSSGWTVLVGRNSRENDALTFGVAGPDDVWFHARGVAGSHVVLLRRGRKEIPDKGTVEEVAALAAFFSKGRRAALVPVSYTERRYVRRPRKGHPGTAIVDREKTVMVEPKRIQHPSSFEEK